MLVAAARAGHSEALRELQALGLRCLPVLVVEPEPQARDVQAQVERYSAGLPGAHSEAHRESQAPGSAWLVLPAAGRVLEALQAALPPVVLRAAAQLAVAHRAFPVAEPRRDVQPVLQHEEPRHFPPPDRDALQPAVLLREPAVRPPPELPGVPAQQLGASRQHSKADPHAAEGTTAWPRKRAAEAEACSLQSLAAAAPEALGEQPVVSLPSASKLGE